MKIVTSEFSRKITTTQANIHHWTKEGSLNILELPGLQIWNNDHQITAIKTYLTGYTPANVDISASLNNLSDNSKAPIEDNHFITLDPQKRYQLNLCVTTKLNDGQSTATENWTIDLEPNPAT